MSRKNHLFLWMDSPPFQVSGVAKWTVGWWDGVLASCLIRMEDPAEAQQLAKARGFRCWRILQGETSKVGARMTGLTSLSKFWRTQITVTDELVSWLVGWFVCFGLFWIHFLLISLLWTMVHHHKIIMSFLFCMSSLFAVISGISSLKSKVANWCLWSNYGDLTRPKTPILVAEVSGNRTPYFRQIWIGEILWFGQKKWEIHIPKSMIFSLPLISISSLLIFFELYSIKNEPS